MGMLREIIRRCVNRTTSHARTRRRPPVSLALEALEDRLTPATPYNIGTPTLVDIWVSPTGNDASSGASRTSALRTLDAAWDRTANLSTTGYRINLVQGSYAYDEALQQWMADRPGTAQHPLIIQSADGPGKAVIQGGMQFDNVSYLYLIDVAVNVSPGASHWGNNVVHFAGSDHVLMRGVTFSGPDYFANPNNYDIQETLKVNQSQYVYIENSDIGGAWHTGLDYVATQYGHIVGTKFHGDGQWGAYLKGGSAHIEVEGNEFYNSVLGFSAGQSTGFEYMVSPWLHYEVYDIKFVNNLIHDIQGVGVEVAGGYNVLVANNTLYRVAYDSRGYGMMAFNTGMRTCDGDTAQCQDNRAAGGWGPTSPDLEARIPNQNVFVYNNILYNPAGTQTAYGTFDLYGPSSNPPGTGLPTTVRADNNLQIKGNIIWDGSPGHELGLDANPTLSSQVQQANAINTIQPQLVNLAAKDYRPAVGGNVYGYAATAIPNFSWSDAPSSPSVPAGNLSNAVLLDYNRQSRSAGWAPVGALTNGSAPALPTLSINDASVTEGNSGTKTATFTVSLSAAAASAVAVSYGTANGTATAGSDFTAASGNLTFAAGETSKTISVTITGDTAVEANETFTLTLSSPTNATIADGQGTGTITNDDTAPVVPAIAVTDASVAEGNSGTKTLNFTVSLSAATTSTVSVNYATSNGTATAGSDYTAASGTLTFAAGQTSKTVAVTITGDTTVEPNETFTINLSAAVNGTITDAQGTGTITNDETAPVVPAIAVTDASVTEGNSGTKTLSFTVSLSQTTTATVTVNYSTANGTAIAGSDYTAASGTLTIAAGETSKTISVTITGDTTVEADETFTLTLSSPTNATIADGQGTGTITNDDTAPPPLPPPANQGLTAEFFDYTSSLSVLPDLSGRVGDVIRTDTQINYASTSSAWTGLDSRFVDTFASRHTGFLKVDTAGSYTFYLKSDDGSKLWIDGALVVNNDGLHGMRERSATVTLSAGYHHVRAEFFENGGGAGLGLSWAGPGIAKLVIPAGAFYQTDPTGAFQQDAGPDRLVVMEAENYHGHASQGGKSWLHAARAGFAGSSAMQAGPNSGVNINTGYTTSSPRLDYRINFAQAGTYYVRIRGLGDTGSDDSVHVGLDGAAVASADRISLPLGSYGWSNATMDGVAATITVTSPGIHTLNLWMREDGAIVDRILLTTNPSFIPTGLGPVESVRLA